MGKPQQNRSFENRDCEICGNTFRARVFKDRPTLGRFCSLQCNGVARSRAPRAPWQHRFHSYVDKREPDECWNWTAALDARGYGVFNNGSPTVRKAHRLAYELANSPIPKGRVICHHCDNPACCNPKHLYAGTQADNGQDMAARSRGTVGEKNRHAKLTWEQVDQIRSARKTAKETASEFGVTPDLINMIRRNAIWKPERRPKL